MKFNIREIDLLESTNVHAHKLLEAGELQEGDVILTHNQAGGKGLGENSWESEPGCNLTVSIIFEPDFIQASQQFVLTQVVSLAIHDVIGSYLTPDDKSQLKIKWPNDVYVNEKKIAGILFQNFVAGNKLESSIAGIGININQKKFYSDARNPVSLIHFTDTDITVVEILNRLLERISVRYGKIRETNNITGIESEYMEKLYRFNRNADYLDTNGRFTGKITDVDEFGRLIIVTKEGERRKYMFKEVEFL